MKEHKSGVSKNKQQTQLYFYQRGKLKIEGPGPECTRLMYIDLISTIILRTITLVGPLLAGHITGLWGWLIHLIPPI